MIKTEFKFLINDDHREWIKDFVFKYENPSEDKIWHIKKDIQEKFHLVIDEINVRKNSGIKEMNFDHLNFEARCEKMTKLLIYILLSVKIFEYLKTSEEFSGDLLQKSWSLFREAVFGFLFSPSEGENQTILSNIYFYEFAEYYRKLHLK